MKVLTSERACVVIKLSDVSVSSLPLQEQVRGLMQVVPFLILDVAGIHFTSMLLGEVVNLFLACDQVWKERRHGLALVNVSEVSRQVFRIAKLNDKLPIYDSLEQAWAAVGQPGTPVGLSA
ncbi:MAG TPA: hypothetical protein VL359_07885 [bacterium]|nr:hypothetical protein [bacterium]